MVVVWWWYGGGTKVELTFQRLSDLQGYRELQPKFAELQTPGEL